MVAELTGRSSLWASIYITHDLAVVAQMADRVMVLRYGELVEEAPTGAMLADPKMPYTKSLWAVRSLHKEEQKGEELLLDVRGDFSLYMGSRVRIRLPPAASQMRT